MVFCCFVVILNLSILEFHNIKRKILNYQVYNFRIPNIKRTIYIL